jgi:uncharacterized membrane protein YhiD involved in acid resistance
MYWDIVVLNVFMHFNQLFKKDKKTYEKVYICMESNRTVKELFSIIKKNKSDNLKKTILDAINNNNINYFRENNHKKYGMKKLFYYDSKNIEDVEYMIETAKKILLYRVKFREEYDVEN